MEIEYPNAKIEVWAFDEHRLGLQPIIRKIWVRRGKKAIAKVYPRFEWLYLYGFVEPETGNTEWMIMPRIGIVEFGFALKKFAELVGAGKDKRIVLVLDNAGWHTSPNLEIPEGIHFESLPPYSPELQPAERLWSISDEPIANKVFKNLGELSEVLVKRCLVIMDKLKVQVRNLTCFKWWPLTIKGTMPVL